jgi:hypothetical protein
MNELHRAGITATMNESEILVITGGSARGPAGS